MKNDFLRKLKKIKWVKSWEANVGLFWVDVWMRNYEEVKYRKIFGCDGSFYAVTSRNKLGLEAYLNEKDVARFSKQGFKFFKDISRVEQFICKSHKTFKKYINFTKNVSKLSQDDLKKMPHWKIGQLTKKLFELHADFAAYTKIALPGYSDRVSRLLMDYCFKKDSRNGYKIYEAITAPTKLSIMDKEIISLLEIAIKYYRNTNSDKFKQELRGHQKRYGWFGTGEGTAQLNYKYFKEEINKLWEKEKKDLVEQYKTLRNKTIISENRIRIFDRRYKIGKKTMNMTKALRLVADLQLNIWRMGYVMSLVYLSDFFQNLQYRLNVNESQFQHLTAQEILYCLENNKKINIQNFNRRLPCYVYVLFEAKKRLITGKRAKSLIDYIERSVLKKEEKKEIKGLAVFWGVAQGKVKILSAAKHNLSREIKKVKDGEIVVTSMMRPHLLPALAKAGGVITNEGGLTSHAAIMARELKVPTIVGAKIATKVLKDGQLVEVDANKGIVRIIK